MSLLKPPVHPKKVDAEPTQPRMEAVEAVKYVTITEATYTAAKTGAGILYRIVVNGGTLGPIMVYDADSVSGIPITTITHPEPGMVLQYGVEFATGLAIVTTADTNINVAFY